MSEPCGCKIVLKGDVTIVHGDEGSDIYEIVYCPKHQAVDRLLEAAKKLYQEYDECNGCLNNNDGIDGCGKCEPCLILRELGEAITAASA